MATAKKKKKTPTKKTAPATKAKAKAKPNASKAKTPKTKAKPKAKPRPAPRGASKPAAKKPAPKAKAAPPKPPTKPAKAAPPPSTIDSHPSYAKLVAKLAPGRHAGGVLIFTEPGALDEVMSPWLMGRIEGRRSLGRTAFGDIVVFRDLRDRARSLGLADAETACDVAMVDVHYKQMRVLAESVEELLASVDDEEWQRDALRREMYHEVRERLGDYADDECYYFGLALSLGGSEDAKSVDRGDWFVHQEILRQT